MTSNPDQSPDSPGKPSPARPSSALRGDWVLVIARILFLLALVLMVVPVYEVWQADEDTDFDGWEARTTFCLVTGFCLLVVSAVLSGLRKFKLLQSGTILRAWCLSDEHRYGAPSWDELQNMGGTKGLFTWVMDGVGMIAVVFLLAWGACVKCNTEPIFAAVFLTFAVLYPSMAKRSQRTREALFGDPSRGESRRSSR